MRKKRDLEVMDLDAMSAEEDSSPAGYRPGDSYGEGGYSDGGDYPNDGYQQAGYQDAYPQDGQQSGYQDAYPQDGQQSGYQDAYPQDGQQNGYQDAYPQDGQQSGYQNTYPQDGYQDGGYQNPYPQDGQQDGYGYPDSTGSQNGGYAGGQDAYGSWDDGASLPPDDTGRNDYSAEPETSYEPEEPDIPELRSGTRRTGKSASRSSGTASSSGRTSGSRRSSRSSQRGASGRGSAGRGSSSRKSSSRRKNGKRGKSSQGGFLLPWYVHLILLGVIVAIAVIAVVRFNIWNKGKTVEIDPNAQTMYSVEVNDNIVFLSDSKLAGKTDDGVTTVLCLGDAPFSDDTTESGLAGQIAALSGVTAVNASFPGSQVTCLNATYQTDTQKDMDDVFNLFYVAYDISIGDFTNLETVSAFHTDNPQYAAAVEALKSTDFQSLDYIAIMYDAVDYENGMSMYNADNPDDLTCYVGSLTNALQLLQNKYPWISIVFLSPTYVEHNNGDGTYSDARTLNLGNGTLNQYWAYSYDVCGDLSVSFLDNYYGSINDSNFTEYLTDDHFHINAAGRTKIADHFVYKVIQGNYSEYNAGALMVAGNSSADTAVSTQ